MDNPIWEKETNLINLFQAFGSFMKTFFKIKLWEEFNNENSKDYGGWFGPNGKWNYAGIGTNRLPGVNE